MVLIGMSKKISVGFLINIVLMSIALTIIVTVFLVSRSYRQENGELAAELKKYELVDEIEKYIENAYYGEVDDEKAMNEMLASYVASLDDKYSRYQSPEEYRISSVNDAGNRIGIGITVKYREDDMNIEIMSVNAESPAEEADLHAGDIITGVDGQKVADVGYMKAINLVGDGETGSIIKLNVLRDNEPMDIEVIRKEITVVTAEGKMLEDNIGYVKLSHFSGNTGEQFNNAVNELIEQGANGFVFDVRNNGGGYVTTVEECLDPFLPEGDIAIAKYKDGKEETIIKSDNEEMDIPMTILINGNSASGAELFSAALRDFGKAELVGVKSYGKGVMQDTFKLSNGGALTLTVAYYQTVKSDCYHGIGIEPDYEIDMEDDSKTDVQLEKAIEVVKKSMSGNNAA